MANAFASASNMDVTAADAPNLSGVTSLQNMFANASSLVGNSSFDDWDVSNVVTMAAMFKGTSSFNQPVGNWDTSSVTNMSNMFQDATSFNQPINSWDVSHVTNFGAMFQNTSFNQAISSWDTGNATNIGNMFRQSSFNQPIGNWDVSSVTSMSDMFKYAVFNQPIGNWDAGNVTTMAHMFEGNASFNQPIGNWDTSSVTIMAGMFQGASSFNQPIGNWDVGNVTSVSGMFAGIFIDETTRPALTFSSVPMSFNQDISSWDTGGVTTMQGMFTNDHEQSAQNLADTDTYYHSIGYTSFPAIGSMYAHPFSYALANWDISHVTNMTLMFSGASLSPSAYDSMLIAWSTQPLQSGIVLGADTLHYCSDEAAAAQQSIVNTFGWTIIDAGQYCEPESELDSPDMAATPGVPNTGIGLPANHSGLWGVVTSILVIVLATLGMIFFARRKWLQ